VAAVAEKLLVVHAAIVAACGVRGKFQDGALTN
jgi:hypothetical protein